jgi:hypothetical protein
VAGFHYTGGPPFLSHSDDAVIVSMVLQAVGGALSCGWIDERVLFNSETLRSD